MAGFNGSGTFVRTYNWVTDKSNSVLVTASRFDTEDDGFATGLSNAICKDGQQTTTAAIPFAVGVTLNDGSASSPSYTFTSETTTGLYRIGTKNLGIAAGGGKVWDIGTATSSVAGALVVSGAVNAACFRNYIAGFTLSNDSGTPNTIIDIAAGSCMDGGNTNMMVGAAITKTTGSWAVGDTNGGLDTGSVATSTWYHVYIIMRPDTGVVDALISTSATSPTMPSNYTKKRRIGSFLTDGSGHIITFTQFGDEFLWKKPVVDTNGTVTPSTSTQSLVTLSTPLGVDVYARLYIAANYVSSGGATQFYAPDMGAQGGNSWSSTGFGLNVVTGYRYMSAPADIRTNTSSQVAATNETAVNNTITVVTLGWRDRRGQDA